MKFTNQLSRRVVERAPVQIANTFVLSTQLHLPRKNLRQPKLGKKLFLYGFIASFCEGVVLKVSTPVPMLCFVFYGLHSIRSKFFLLQLIPLASFPLENVQKKILCKKVKKCFFSQIELNAASNQLLWKQNFFCAAFGTLCNCGGLTLKLKLNAWCAQFL